MKTNIWAIYDELIDGIDPELEVRDFLIGSCWTKVSTEDSCGIALAVKDRARSFDREGAIIGAKLIDIARGAKSWNMAEASLGMAAINCYYNDPARLDALGLLPAEGSREKDAFIEFAGDVVGKNVCVVGHFPNIERQLADKCNLSVLERNQLRGDYPDSACEFILPEQDIVFITGMTFTNKTVVRLLDIIPASSRVSLVGPSVPASATLFKHNVDNLSCFSVRDEAALDEALRRGTRDIFHAGSMLSINRSE